MFFRKKQKFPRNYAPLDPSEEAQPLACGVPRPLEFEGRAYTVLDELVYQGSLYLICSAGGRITVLESDGADHCAAVQATLSDQIYMHYLLQPK